MNEKHISAGNMRHTPARQFASQIVGGAGMAPLSHTYEMNENGFETDSRGRLSLQRHPE
jgi:hypothetical protein